MFFMNQNISYLQEDDILIILDFNTGNYYKLTGLVVDIILLIGNNKNTLEIIRKNIEEKYSDEEFLINDSISCAISMLKEKGFIFES